MESGTFVWSSLYTLEYCLPLEEVIVVDESEVEEVLIRVVCVVFQFAEEAFDGGG